MVSQQDNNTILVDKITDYKTVFSEVEINPVGRRQLILNRRGKIVEPRKMHLTDKQQIKLQQRFKKIVEGNDKQVQMAGEKFYNPYRSGGPYYGGVQALFLLGANIWHHEKDVRKTMEELMKKIFVPDKLHKALVHSWNKFNDKKGRGGVSDKDTQGRIRQNFRLMQRLKGLTPYGLKLAQSLSCIDIKYIGNSSYSYKLNTNHNLIDEISPIYVGPPRKNARKQKIRTN